MPREKPSVRASSDFPNNRENSALGTAWGGHGALYDSHHTQPASLINGATVAIDVALARVTYGPALCSFQQGFNELEERHWFHPLARWWEWMRVTFNVRLAPGCKLCHWRRKKQKVLPLCLHSQSQDKAWKRQGLGSKEDRAYCSVWLILRGWQAVFTECELLWRRKLSSCSTLIVGLRWVGSWYFSKTPEQRESE